MNGVKCLARKKDQLDARLLFSKQNYIEKLVSNARNILDLQRQMTFQLLNNKNWIHYIMIERNIVNQSNDIIVSVFPRLTNFQRI